MKVSLAQLRSHAIGRSLFAPTTLNRAVQKLGFVQADPIRAPARAQDLTLRHRVKAYRAGDLERRYPTMSLEEDYFVNYGFLPRTTQILMHPRSGLETWTRARWKQVNAVRDWIAERGAVHPREVNQRFAHGKARNWFGGASNASTQLLDRMHYRGLLRVAGREDGIRLYAARAETPGHIEPRAGMDTLVDAIVAKYAPLPAATLGTLLRHLCVGTPQWRGDRSSALQRAKRRLAHTRIEGIDWFWPGAERLRRREPDGVVRLLTPFDPIVWDRRRFELFWGWPYRFEAYTPASKRKLGYYALPLLWRDAVIGWANARLVNGKLTVEVGYVDGRAPRDAAYERELEAEFSRLRSFLGESSCE